MTTTIVRLRAQAIELPVEWPKPHPNGARMNWLVMSDPFFADFLLVRMARLSVMPVTDAQWDRILSMAG